MYALHFCSYSPQIPPAPPKPDFDEPRHKLAKLREGELFFPLLLCTGVSELSPEQQRRVVQDQRNFVVLSYPLCHIKGNGLKCRAVQHCSKQDWGML